MKHIKQVGLVGFRLKFYLFIYLSRELPIIQAVTPYCQGKSKNLV